MKRILSTFLAIAALSMATSANAGSYQLNDYSVTGLGRAYAGAGVVGDDYSAIAYNPAGMALMKKSGMQTGLTLVNLRADVEGLGNTNHKKMDFWAPIPQFFGQYNVNDKLSLGLGIYAPFGLKTVYDSGWFGEDVAILSKLDIIDINLAASYRLNQQWTVGAGVIARYIYGHMTNAVHKYGDVGTSDFELDGWTKTGILGVMYEPTENTRFGLSYRLRSTQQVKGDHKVEGFSAALAGQNGVFTGRASPALPDTVTLSAFHKYNQFGFSGTARWTHWSQSFPKFVMSSDSGLLAPTNGERVSHYNYSNSWTLTAGVDYYHNQNWTFRAGTGWDESPAHEDANRTIRIPDNDRFWLSCGFSYIQPTWQLDVGYTHMIARTAKALEVSDPESVDVKYKNMQSHIIGAQVQYKF